MLPGAVATDVELSQISRWGIGGVADVVVSPRTTEELARLRAFIHENELPSVIVGATSNLLFADEGLRAVVIRIGQDFAPLCIDKQRVVAGPGVWVPGLARKAMLAGLAGLEHTCGIPGTLGGLVCMNGGSQRKGIGEVVVQVESVDVEGNLRVRTQAECGFRYRTSIFQENDEAISSVVLRLDYAQDRVHNRKAMLAILRDRRQKFPQKQPNCGSVFVSNPAMYSDYGSPGKVIEDAGYKGFKVGGAQVSSEHANFINNLGDASAQDVLRLISMIRSHVATSIGYRMAVEARYVEPSGEIISIDSICDSGWTMAN